MEIILILAALLLVAFLYGYSGGLGGMIARTRSSPAHSPALNDEDLRISRPDSKDPSPSTDPFASIDTFHSNELNAVRIDVAQLIPELVSASSFHRLGLAMADKLAHFKHTLGDEEFVDRAATEIQSDYLATLSENALRNAGFQRTLRDMSDAERATLRLADMLEALGEIAPRDNLQIRVPIIWNKGNSLLVSIAPFSSADRLAELRATLSTLFLGHFGETTAATERLQAALRRALRPDSGLTAADRATLDQYLFTGAKWMTPQAAATVLVPSLPPRPSALRLGTIEGSQTELIYDHNESLITIAPPGQGKSQAVMRNLLSVDGGALVIDVKGELFENTAVWRARNVGPVYRFAPGDPDRSISFNPLDAVRPALADAYEDATKLVELMMVPLEAHKKDYWDKRGLELLADAVLDTAMCEQGIKRTVCSVFDRLFVESQAPSSPTTDDDDDDDDLPNSIAGSELELWLVHLKETRIRKLERAATAIRNMPVKTRENVFDTARTHIGVWQSPRIEQLTMTSTFDPLSLRRDKATLYICVSMDELQQYASMLRALIGQTFYSLCRGKADRTAPVVTFFLDEMPQLRRMDILEKALDLGRSYGVRPWMFAQNYGQIAEHYKNPDGFLQNSMVRQFMGIDTALALKLSKEMSERHGLIDGRRHPLVEPHDLTGEAFRDLALTIVQGHPPARIVKPYAYKEDADRIQPASSFDYSGGILKI